MALRNLFAGMTGGATIDTILTSPSAYPGGTITGTVTVTGGQVEQTINAVDVALVVRVEVESGDHEFTTTMALHTQRVFGSFLLAPAARYGIEFSIPVPWEAPISAVGGRALRGMFVGVQTDVDIARGVDKGDLDPVAIHPLPAQDRILDALTRLGFAFRSADVERGRVAGSQLPFYQEIEFHPSREFLGRMSELEVSFIAGPVSMDVLLEADRRGGFLTEGRDTYLRFTVPYATADRTDWEGQLRAGLQQMLSRRGWR